jgi:hypothetical protein
MNQATKSGSPGFRPVQEQAGCLFSRVKELWGEFEGRKHRENARATWEVVPRPSRQMNLSKKLNCRD